MDLDFGNNRLRRNYTSSRDAVRDWGEDVARKYIQRIDQIIAAPDLHALGKLPSVRLHPLRGERTGEYALDLVGRWRLIVTIENDAVLIREVSNHYGD